MLSLSPQQTALLNADSKTVKWMILITDKNGTMYRFVTEPLGGMAWMTGVSWDSGTTWDAGINLSSILIVDFGPIILRSPLSAGNTIPPNETGFTVSNPNNTLVHTDFNGGTVLIEVYVANIKYPDTKITGWKFKVKRVEPGYQQLFFECQDFLQEHLQGDYPNGQYPKGLWPSDDTDLDDKLCIPVPIGTAYIPLRSVYITDQRYYLLGLVTVNGTAVTYTISKVRSPRSWGTKTEWEVATYAMTQATKAGGDGTNYRVFQPIIAPVGGPYTLGGFWRDGTHFLDVPTKFTRSDTSGLTNPADAIEFILKDFGIASSDIDSAVTFLAANANYDTLGIEWNGGIWRKQTRQAALTSLLVQCHSTLRIGEKIELHPLSKTSRMTITKAEVLRPGEIGPGSFRYRTINERLTDCAYVSWQQSDEAQDEFLKALVPVSGSKDVIDEEIFNIHLVQDSQDVQRLGILHYQRRLGKIANVSASLKSKCLKLQPDDVITISHADYGGTYNVTIDTVKISKDLTVDIDCTRFNHVLDDWMDIVNNDLAWDTGIVWDTGVIWDASLAPLISVAVDDTAYVMP